MPAREISFKEAAEAVAARANGSARRLWEIAATLENLGEHLQGPVFEMVKIQVMRLRDEAHSLNGERWPGRSKP